MLEQFVIAIQIILIDIVMAADNAIIIGLIAANFAPQNKKKIGIDSLKICHFVILLGYLKLAI